LPYIRRAVAGNLRNVFTGVGVRASEHTYQHIIYRFIPVPDGSEMQRMRILFFQFARMEHLVAYPECVLSGKAYD